MASQMMPASTNIHEFKDSYTSITSNFAQFTNNSKGTTIITSLLLNLGRTLYTFLPNCKFKLV